MGAVALAALASAAWADPPDSTKPVTTAPAKDAAAKPAPAKSTAPGQKPTPDVVVTAAPQAYRSSIDRKSYTLGKDLQASTGSIGDALRNLPSVQVDVQGNLSVRGDSSVTILVDGQPSPLFSGPNRADALQQLPADQFERVEVITNPSAAFKPDGSGGIINLVTKKGRSNGGMIGSIKANIGTDSRYNGGVSASYSTKAFTVTGGANAGLYRSRGDSESTGQIIDPVTGKPVATGSTSTSKSSSTSYSVYGNTSYELDAKDRLTGGGSLFESRFNSLFNAAYHSDAPTGPAALDYTTDGRTAGQFHGAFVNGGYVHKFSQPEQQLSVNLNYGVSAGGFANISTLHYTRPVQPNLFQDVGSRNSNGNLTLQAEYKGPMPGGGKIVAGYQLEDSRQAIDHPVVLGTSAADAVQSPLLSNLFKFDQAVHALYATYEQPFGPLTVLPGVRLEETVVDLHQVTTGENDSLDYFRIYPTLHLAYQLTPDQELKASYSRRVNRPGAQQLNPFRLYNGPLSFSQGNPHLLPQTTDSYELGYELKAKGGIYYSATLYHRDSRDNFQSVTQDLGGGVLLNTTVNLGESRNTGLELVANGKLWKTLSYNATTNLFWNEINAGNLGFAGTRSTFTESGRINLNWEPTPKDLLQLNLFATAKTLTPQGFRDGVWTVNLGYRHKIDDRWSAVVTVQDPFDTNHFHSVIDTPTLKQDSRSNFHQRGLFFGLVYALGNPNARRPETFDYNTGGGPGGGAPSP